MVHTLVLKRSYNYHNIVICSWILLWKCQGLIFSPFKCALIFSPYCQQDSLILKLSNLSNVYLSVHKCGSIFLWHNGCFLVEFLGILYFRKCFWIINTHFILIVEFNFRDSNFTYIESILCFILIISFQIKKKFQHILFNFLIFGFYILLCFPNAFSSMLA